MTVVTTVTSSTALMVIHSPLSSHCCSCRCAVEGVPHNSSRKRPASQSQDRGIPVMLVRPVHASEGMDTVRTPCCTSQCWLRPEGLCKAVITCAGGCRGGNHHDIQGAGGVCKSAAYGRGECCLWHAAPRSYCASSCRKHELCGPCWDVLGARCLPPGAGETSGVWPSAYICPYATPDAVLCCL